MEIHRLFFNLILASLHCDTGEVFDEKKATETSNFGYDNTMRDEKEPRGFCGPCWKNRIKAMSIPIFSQLFLKGLVEFFIGYLLSLFLEGIHTQNE